MKKSLVRRFNIHLKRKTLNEGYFKIAFLSDLHNCEWSENNEKLIELIRKENPQLILCGGDMTVAHPGEEDDIALEFISKISREQKVYYALGNHEYRLGLYPEVYGKRYEGYMRKLKNLGVAILDNDMENVTIGGNDISIYGLSIDRKYYKRFTKLTMPADYIDSLIGKPDIHKLNILLAHTPKYMSSYLKWGADITFSGHYHGGVVQLGKNRGLISPDPCILPRNAHGMYEFQNRFEIISAGLGEHTIPVRFNNPRELVIAEVFINR